MTDPTITTTEATTEYVVIYVDGDGRDPVCVAPTQELAYEFVSAQKVTEDYEIEPIPRVTALPEAGTFYTFKTRISYSDPAVNGYVHRYEVVSFPGMFDHEPVNVITNSLTEASWCGQVSGWDIVVSGWDLEQVQARFDELWAEAVTLREQRAALVGEILPGTLLTGPLGIMFRVGAPKSDNNPNWQHGYAYWQHADGRVLADSEVDLTQWTVTRPDA